MSTQQFFFLNQVDYAAYLFNLSVPYKEAAQRVAGVHLGALQRHHDAPVLLAVLRGPVLVTLPLKDKRRVAVQRI